MLLQHHSAVTGVHTVDVLAGSEVGCGIMAVAQSADHGQVQSHICLFTQLIQVLHSSHSGSIVPAGNHQLAIDLINDPLVLFDPAQSGGGSSIAGSTQQQALA